jgi:NADPH-dependent 2,4-dienoyl-CoA reductase/sulfur reductase-like enzyme
LNEQLIIIGGVAAGLAAAMQARRAAPSLPITVLERTGDISYGACGIPYVLSGVIPSLADLTVHAPAFFKERHSIDIALHTDATEIMPARSVVRVKQNGRDKEYGFTKLIIATGAFARCPPISGHDLPGVFVLRHLGDARRILEFIEGRRPERVVVVGAGYIGLEMAEAFCARGAHVTLINANDRVMNTIDGDLRDQVVDELRRHDVEVVMGEKVAEIAGSSSGVTGVVTDGGRSVAADLVCLGIGVHPQVELARAAGIELGKTGAIATDERQRTNLSHIYAAGDCCEIMHRVSGQRVWFPLGQPAVRQGWVAGDNVAERDAVYAGVVGTNAVKVFDLEVARTGLSADEANAAGFDATVFEDRSSSRAGYYPGGTEIRTRLIADRRTGRLLGAQMAGREGVAQRIDVFAAAMHMSLKVDQIEAFDLAYAPPFGPTIDPIQRAAHKARRG